MSLFHSEYKSKYKEICLNTLMKAVVSDSCDRYTKIIQKHVDTILEDKDPDTSPPRQLRVNEELYSSSWTWNANSFTRDSIDWQSKAVVIDLYDHPEKEALLTVIQLKADLAVTRPILRNYFISALNLTKTWADLSALLPEAVHTYLGEYITQEARTLSEKEIQAFADKYPREPALLKETLLLGILTLR